jgi:outer membrane receptor for ferrienterochelin and colicins
MRTGILLAILLFGGAGAAEAQDGQVVDRRSGAPVPMAQILWRVEGPGAEPVGRVEADASGRFRLRSSWQDGWIEVRSLGHRTVSLSWAEAGASGWRIELDPDPLELESVLVTAAGRAQRRSEISVPIAQVSRDEIRAQSPPSVASLLAEMPGLQSQSSPPTGSNIMIRGIGESRVLVLLDGQPASGALLENRDLSRISLAAVERVEVVKGPLSSLYGSDALGGVINIVTTDPEGGFSLEARALSGGGGRYEADVTVSGGGDVRYRATGGWRQQDQVPGLDDASGAFARVWDARSTVRYTGFRGVSLRADASVVRERQRWPVGGGFSGFNDNTGLSAWTQATVVHGPGEWTARVFGQDYRHLYRSARGTAPIAGAGENLQQERYVKATVAYGASLGAHRLDVGVDGSNRAIESPDKILEDRAADGQLELYVQDAWTVRGATLSAGLRATLNDRWGNTTSPTVGITALPSATVRLRAVVGRGFRAPSFKELAWDFANLGAGYTVQGNPDLRPETSWNVTAGADWAPSPELRLGVEAYANHIDDLIESAFIGNNPSGLLVYSPRNFSRARTRGLEVSASSRFGAWDVRAEYAYLDARSLDDRLPLDRRASHSGRVRVATSLPLLDGLRVHAGVHGTGAAPIVGPDGSGRSAIIGMQDVFVSVDLQATVPLPGSLRMVLGVDNLLDARPDGWQAVVERRFRAGVEARDLFRN